MKKVLILGYFWPYRGGSGRMLGLAKYLTEFGWEPTIVTAPLEYSPTKAEISIRYFETSYYRDVFTPWKNFIAKLISLESGKSVTQQLKTKAGITSRFSLVEWIRTKYQEIFAYPDTEKYWGKPALKISRELIANEKFNAILSVWPITAHLVAKLLKQEFKIPWVADFPDPWSENHAYPYGSIRKRLDRSLEIKTLNSTDALTAASPMYAKKETQVNKRSVETILHGFDPREVNEPVYPLTTKFTITYTGTIYDEQDPTKILAALRGLIDAGKLDPNDLEIRFYGVPSVSFTNTIKQHNLDHIVFQKNRVSHQESLQKQKESQILLMLGWENKKDLGVIPLKLYEYLAARRPILLTGGTPQDFVVEVMRKTKAGIYAGHPQDISDTIEKFYQEYKKNGNVVYRGDINTINQYSYKEMAKKFAAVLNSVAR